MKGIDKPIIIIGAARSGTTLLGNTLKQHPGFCYIEEPNYIWKYGKYRLKTDFFDKRCLSDSELSYIRRWFLNRLNAEDQSTRILEKTPANSLRVSYVNEVFPDALFIHLIRDGRDVAFSAKNKWTKRSDKNKDRIPGESGRFGDLRKQWGKFKQIPLYDVFLNSPELLELFLHKAFGTRLKVWGPKFPGIYDLAVQIPEIEVCALQWLHSVEMAERDLLAIDSRRVLNLRYEDFIQAPESTVDTVCSFAGIRKHEFDLSHINVGGGKMPADIGDLALGHIESKLKDLGYIS